MPPGASDPTIRFIVCCEMTSLTLAPFPRKRRPMRSKNSARSVLCCAALALLCRHSIASDHEFRYKAPDATRVDLMADFNGWKAVPMNKGSDGIWTATVSMPNGTHAYKFLVNGSDWVFDPENANRTKSDGIENSAVDITDGSATAAAQTTAPQLAVAATPNLRTASTPATSSFLSTTEADLTPTPGEVLTIEVPLSDKRHAEATKEGSPKLMHARLAIVVPQGFDPQKSWPIFVVANTEEYSNIDSLQQFKQAAVDEGWVILAADGVELEKNKEGSIRWPCLGAAFDYLTSVWPAMKNWPVACGGMSGGAKNSSFLAADLARENHRVIGILMMGCNQDMATVAYRKGGAASLLNAAVFLSSGKSDTIATPAHHEAVKRSLQGTGFHKVRLESHNGAHDIYQPHISEALRWFIAEAAPSSNTQSASRSSDFDKFFHKKP